MITHGFKERVSLVVGLEAKELPPFRGMFRGPPSSALLQLSSLAMLLDRANSPSACSLDTPILTSTILGLPWPGGRVASTVI